MKQNYQIRIGRFLLVLMAAISQFAFGSGTAADRNDVNTSGTMANTVFTGCSGTGTAASEGTFTTGYNYTFSTTGSTVNVAITLLDNKSGVVAYVRTQTPFSEASMANAGGLNFTGTIPNQQSGATIGIAVKFAYAGGMVVTQYINYVVGNNCSAVTDTQAPTAFTATAGTITATSIQLLLNATDDSGTVNYTITYGSTTVNATGSSGVQKSVVINNLSPSTPYTFSITAKDAANNLAANNPLSVQATTAVDTNTACSGTSAQAQGTPGFTTGYTYNFSTSGNTVTATFTLLDTDKTGVVAYLWKLAPNFSESEVLYGNPGLTFSKALTGQTPGSTIQLAMKFAYAGGASTTKYFTYTVGDTCGVVPADTQAPTAFTATAGAVTTSSVELLLNATDNSGTINYTITYGSATVNATGSSGVQKSVVINNLTQNTPYTFSVTAKDAANNVAANNPLSVQATTAIDTNTACSGTSAQAQGAPGFTTGYTYNFSTSGNTVTATFTLLDTDKTGVVAYLWKLAPNFSESEVLYGNPELTFSKALTGQTPGSTIQLAMKFAYAGGASTTKYFTYTVGDTCGVVPADTEAPTAFTATAGTITATSIQLLLNAADNSGAVNYAITYGATTVNATGVSGEQKSVIISNLTPETAYTFSVTAKDAANNVAANNPLSVQATTAVDTNTACSGTSAQAQGTPGFTTGYTYNFSTSGNTVTATFTLLDTDKTGVVAYLWKLAPNFSESEVLYGNPGLTFSKALTGQTPGSVIQMAMKFAYAGGASTTKYFTYTVGDTCAPPVVDTQAPTAFTATAGTITATSIQLLLNAADNSGAVNYAITYGTTTVNATGISGEQKSVIISNLTPETAYTFSITAKDAANNVAANSPLSVQATTAVDTSTACSGTSAQAQGTPGFTTGYTYDFVTNGSSVTATFTLLDTDKTGVIAYLWSLNPNFSESEVLYGNPGLTFTKTLNGQTPGSVIQMAMKFAYAGGASTTKYFTYTVGDTCVPPVLDTEVPQNFTATVGQVTSTSVELLLNATDDSGEVTYNITYGGTTIAISGISGEQLSHIITPLSPETAYSFSIAASDDYGNQAANNAIVVPVTTPAHNNTPCAGIDSEATDGGFSTGYNYDFATNGTDVTVTFTLLDSDKTGVVAYLRQQSPLLETPMAHVSGLTYSVTLQGLTQGTLLTYAVKFAYAGGQSVTKYFDYIVGDTCAGGTGDVFTTVWENGTWSNGIPVSYQYAAVINDDYYSATNGEIIAASLSVAGGEVVVADGDNFTILGAVEVDNEATFTLQNNANLIQENNEQNTGEISVVKDSAPMYRLDYALWGSPVSGQNLQLFSENTLSNRFYTYNPVNDTYNSIAPDTNDFATGKGYLIRVANNHLDFVSNDIAPVSWTGTFKGVPNNGDINVPVTPALDAEGDENDIKGFNAISNPYPSAINIAAFFEENQANLANNTPIFFWRKKNGAGTSSYCSLTLAGYNANSGNAFGDSSNGLFSNPNTSEDWVINSGQGFIVRATSGTVSFKNSMRRAVNNNQMFRNAINTQVEKSRLWLNITNAEGTFGQTTIAYTPTTTTGLDYGWDGTAITDGELAIYSLAGQSKLGIQARAAFDAADVVPVEYKVNAAGEYTISLDHFDGVFDQGQDIFLRDNLLGITHDLKLSPYSFTSNTGVVTARFDVVYAEALNTATPEFDSNSLIVYKQGNAINITTGATDMKSVAVYDVHGRLLYSAANVNAATTSITTLQAQGQMLIVQVGTTQGMKASRKIVF